ncbi:uncharacterized protein rab44 isoform X2 [Nerophis ophidion]|uniref:uncharacterized protein rab44 isoform X2 n=1 Tax=Nerophis ophidion TaxID=159077 RepID=UPI002AE070BA|nr:uncharacterized protein rab44 isoform X2 [Nerophis ophidion]
MPGPSGKKRLGSRRKMIKHEMPEKFTSSHQSPVPQAEESTDDTLLETDTLSSVQKANRSRLGSNPQSHRSYEVEQTATVSYHKPPEEVEQNANREQLQATQIIPTEQALKGGSNKADEYDAMYGAHIYTATTFDDTLDAVAFDVEILQPKNETLHLNHNAEDSGFRLVVEPCKPVENTGSTAEVDVSSTHSTDEQQQKEQAEVHTNPITNDTEEEMIKGTDLLPLVEHSAEGSNFRKGPESALYNSDYDYSENDENECCVEQPDYSLAIKEHPANEEHEHFDISEVQGAQHSDTVHENVKSSEMGQDERFDLLTHDHREHTDETIEHSKNEIMDMAMHRSELVVQSRNDSDIHSHEKQEDHLSKDVKVEVPHKGDENDPISNTNIDVLTNVDNTEHTPPQEHDVNAQAAYDELCADRAGSEIEEGELVLQRFVVNSQSEGNSLSADEQRASPCPTRSRRKMGSSRRNKWSSVEVFDTNSDSKSDAVGKMHDNNLPELASVAAEFNLGETLPIKNVLETTQSENVCDLVKSAHVGPNLKTSNIHSTVAQPLTEQSNSRETPVEEHLSKVKIETQVKENPTFLTRNGAREEGCLVNKPRVDANELHSLNNAEFEDHQAKATLLSPKAETSTYDVEHEQVDTVLVHELWSPKTDQKVDSEMLILEVKEDINEHINHLVEEIVELETNQSHDANLNPNHISEEGSMKGDNMELLNQSDTNSSIIKMMDSINRDGKEHSQPQEHYIEPQIMSDDKLNAERVVSGIEGSELTSQSVQQDKSFDITHHNEDTNVSSDELREFFHPNKNRRKLGSSRRNKISPVKIFDTYIESQNYIARKAGDDHDLQETVTSTLETTDQENTSCDKDAHTESSGAKTTIVSPKEEMSTKLCHCFISSESQNAQRLEEDAQKMHMVYPVEINEVDRTDHSLPQARISVETMQTDAPFTHKSYKELLAEGTSNTGDDTVTIEMTVQQMSQEQIDARFKSTEQLEGKVDQEEDISPKLDKEDLPEPEGEDTDNPMCCTNSTLNVQEAQETFRHQNLQAVSLKKELLTDNVMVPEKYELKKNVPIADNEEVEGGVEKKPSEAFDLKENCTILPEVGACDTGIPKTVDTCQDQQALHEESLNWQVKNNANKRKMGSTRKCQINRKQEAQMDSLLAELDMRSLENMEVLEDVSQKEAFENQRTDSLCEEGQETNKDEDDDNQELHSTSGESHMISATESLAVLPEQASYCHTEDANPLTFQVDDLSKNDKCNDTIVDGLSGNVKCIDTFEPDHDAGFKVHINTSVDTELYSSCETTQNKGSAPQLKDLKNSRSEEHVEAQTNTQVSKTESVGAPDKNTETKSPNLSSTHRKRRMGSSRKNLGTMSKGDLDQKLDMDKEASVAVHVQDVMFESASKSEDKDLTLLVRHKNTAAKENVVLSHTSDTQNKAPIHGKNKEHITSEHHLAPREDFKETPPELKVLSELAPEGRRRKLGSHRKSRGGHQTQLSQGEDSLVKSQPQALTTITDEHADEIIQSYKDSQSHESDIKPSSDITTTKSARSKTSQDVTSSHDPYNQVLLGQDTQKNISSGHFDVRAQAYNVVMIGDSCVGKTSFMRRAQNGKFYPDMPASVGLDTCMWTVVVEEKLVVLQLWDTAGQERFHSVTKQLFHKAHAFLLMYDITSWQSFTSVHFWASCIQEGAVEKNIPILLLGNKSDDVRRSVKTEDGQNVAKEYNADFMECSAVTGDNVIQSLEAVARLLSQTVGGQEEGGVLHKEPAKKTSGCC